MYTYSTVHEQLKQRTRVAREYSRVRLRVQSFHTISLALATRAQTRASYTSTSHERTVIEQHYYLRVRLFHVLNETRKLTPELLAHQQCALDLHKHEYESLRTRQPFSCVATRLN